MANKKVKYLGTMDEDVPTGTIGIYKRRLNENSAYVYFEKFRKLCALSNLEFIKD